MNLRTMSNVELERMYYQAGLVEVAAVYAHAADTEAENEEYQERVEKMAEPEEYEKLEKLVEHLQEHIRAADAKLTELYDHISDAPKLNRKAILALITAVKLDPDSEP